MDFDLDDLDLGNALRRVAGAIPDADAAFGTFQRRVRVARIRRISIAVSSSAAVLVLGVGAFALAGRDNAPVSPANQGVTLDPVADSIVADPTTGENDPSTTGVVPGPGSGSGSSTDGTSTSPASGDDGPIGGVTSSTRPDNEDDGESGDEEGEDDEREGNSTTTSSSTSTTVRSSTSTTVAGVSKRCTSAGGSFTAVRLANSVDLRDIVPSAGFSVHETEKESSSAKVVFRSGETEIGLEANWTGSGFTCRLES